MNQVLSGLSVGSL